MQFSASHNGRLQGTAVQTTCHYEFVTADKIPPIDIHCHMQAVYGDKCVDISKFL